MSILCLIGLHKWKYDTYEDNGWFKCERCQTLRECKFCNCCNLIWFAGIGAEGVACKVCGKNQ